MFRKGRVYRTASRATLIDQDSGNVYQVLILLRSTQGYVIRLLTLDALQFTENVVNLGPPS